MSNENNNLTLKGSNKDIWYVVKRVPQSIRFLVEKKFINKSTETSDIVEARKVRDEILAQIRKWEEEAKLGKFDILLNKYSMMPSDELIHFKEQYLNKLMDRYPWAGHREQRSLPNPTDEEFEKKVPPEGGTPQRFGHPKMSAFEINS